MNPTVRGVLAVIAGLAAGWIVITCIELLNVFVLFPLPPGTDITDPKALEAAIKNMPPAAMAVVLVGWLLGTLIGAWVAAKIASHSPSRYALIVGGLFLAATVFNLLSIPHPIWMWVAALALLLPAALLGARLAGPARA
jgi:hypothetical protein